MPHRTAEQGALTWTRRWPIATIREGGSGCLVFRRQGGGRVTEVKVQVVEEDTGDALWGKGKLPDFKDRAKDIGSALKEVADELRTYLDQLEQRRAGWDLDQVSLAFSLDLQAGAAVVLIGTVSSKAGFQATMTWKRSASPAERLDGG